jgi:hypothetical protein
MRTRILSSLTFFRDSRWTERNRLLGIAIAFAAAFGLLAFVLSVVSSGKGAGVSPPTSAQLKTLTAQARKVAQDYSVADTPVNKAVVVTTTRDRISALAGYDTDPAVNPMLGSTDPVFVVALEGEFADYGVQGPAPGPPLTGSQIVFVESKDMKLLDWYMRDGSLVVSKLNGPETELDLTQAPATP